LYERLEEDERTEHMSRMSSSKSQQNGVAHRTDERLNDSTEPRKRQISTCEKEVRLFRKKMQQGYEEMSHINLTIATECLHVEYEAHHTVERLVSGG